MPLFEHAILQLAYPYTIINVTLYGLRTSRSYWREKYVDFSRHAEDMELGNCIFRFHLFGLLLDAWLSAMKLEVLGKQGE